MAWGAPTVIGSTQNKSANQTSLAFTLSAGASVGDLVVVLIAKDNASTTEGDDTTEITGVASSVAQAWERISNWANGTSLGAASVCCAWWTQLTAAWAVSDTVTATFGGTTSSNDAQCGIVVKFSPSAGSLVRFIGVSGLSTDAADPADITLGSLASAAYLWVWALAGEGPETDGYTVDSDYTAITGTGTTGGLDASNQHIRAAYRLMTGTTDTVATASDTADRDYAQLLMAFQEVSFGAAAGGMAPRIAGGRVVI